MLENRSKLHSKSFSRIFCCCRLHFCLKIVCQLLRMRVRYVVRMAESKKPGSEQRLHQTVIIRLLNTTVGRPLVPTTIVQVGSRIVNVF